AGGSHTLYGGFFDRTGSDFLVGVHKLEVSAAGLQEQVTMYENCMSQLEKFQDEKMKEVNEKFDKLSISKAVEKGMQEGLSAGITHGVEGRKLADVVAYNPSAKVDYLSALQRLENVNFSLITKLKSNKDASVDTIINLLRLDDTLTERRIRENIANHVLALRSVFVPLSEPLSAAALEGMEGTSSSAHNATTALSVTFVFVSTILPISTDDYEVAHADGQESTDVGGEAVADKNIDPFPDVSNAKLNILE
nr:nonaspanin [Tanacetum cinerariifolium]